MGHIYFGSIAAITKYILVILLMNCERIHETAICFAHAGHFIYARKAEIKTRALSMFLVFTVSAEQNLECVHFMILLVHLKCPQFIPYCSQIGGNTNAWLVTNPLWTFMGAHTVNKDNTQYPSPHVHMNCGEDADTSG